MQRLLEWITGLRWTMLVVFLIVRIGLLRSGTRKGRACILRKTCGGTRRSYRSGVCVGGNLGSRVSPEEHVLGALAVGCASGEAGLLSCLVVLGPSVECRGPFRKGASVWSGSW